MEFKEYKLEDIIKEIIDYRGKTPKKLGGNWAKSGIKAISAKNIKTGKIVQPETIRFVDENLYKKWMKQEVEKGTILITSEAPFGEIFYWDSEEKIVLSQRIFGLKIKQEYNSKFIYYYMVTKKFQDELKTRATGSTVTGLRQSELLKCKVMIPEKKEQDRIVNILSNIDEKIKINNQISQKLNRIGITLLSEAINKTEKQIELNKIIKFIKGKKPINITNGKIYNYEKYLTIACLNGQELNYAEPNKMIFANNDILMVMDGASSGDIYYSNHGIVGSTLSKIKIINNNYNKGYIYFFIKKYNNLIKSRNTGSAVPHTDKVFVGNLKVPRLNLRQQKKFDIMLNMIQQNQIENSTLEQLRSILLTKLMNEKIKLK